MLRETFPSHPVEWLVLLGILVIIVVLCLPNILQALQLAHQR
jgi:hypothetical protein